MSSKQLLFQNNKKIFEDNLSGKNGNSKLLKVSAFIVDSNKISENNFMLQLQEKEEINDHLSKLVEQSEKKLTDIVATNNRFISIIAHDLRGPFSSILLALELVKQKLDNNNLADVENYLIKATDSVNRTINLLDNLLKWTISQNKERIFNPVKINLYELFLEEIELNKILVNEKHITLKHNVSKSLYVMADIQMFKTIIRNLICNAIKYTNNGGEIEINASMSNGLVKIDVIDNGVGISYDNQRNLLKMESFHSTPGTNNEKGTGFGLLLCKEFIEMHGGTLQIESELGKGSKVKFTIPCRI